MATLSVAPVRVLPNREEWREMLQDRTVAIAAIIAGAFVVLGFVAALVFLAWQDKSTEALTAAVVTPVVATLVSLMSRARRTEEKVDALASKVDTSGS